MQYLRNVLFVLLILLCNSLVAQTQKSPPLSQYMMPRDKEVALARSAAPAKVSAKATIKLLTESGYEVSHEGDNGFVCMVMRGWAAPTYTPVPFRDLVFDTKVLAPICFDPAAVRMVMPYYELRSKLGMQGKTPDQIAEGIQAAYTKGVLAKRDGVSFAYMWSTEQDLGGWCRSLAPSHDGFLALLQKLNARR